MQYLAMQFKAKQVKWIMIFIVVVALKPFNTSEPNEISGLGDTAPIPINGQGQPLAKDPIIDSSQSSTLAQSAQISRVISGQKRLISRQKQLISSQKKSDAKKRYEKYSNAITSSGEGITQIIKFKKKCDNGSLNGHEIASDLCSIGSSTCAVAGCVFPEMLIVSALFQFTGGILGTMENGLTENSNSEQSIWKQIDQLQESIQKQTESTFQQTQNVIDEMKSVTSHFDNQKSKEINNVIANYLKDLNMVSVLINNMIFGEKGCKYQLERGILNYKMIKHSFEYLHNRGLNNYEQVKKHRIALHDTFEDFSTYQQHSQFVVHYSQMIHMEITILNSILSQNNQFLEYYSMLQIKPNISIPTQLEQVEQIATTEGSTINTAIGILKSEYVEKMRFLMFPKIKNIQTINYIISNPVYYKIVKKMMEGFQMDMTQMNIIQEMMLLQNGTHVQKSDIHNQMQKILTTLDGRVIKIADAQQRYYKTHIEKGIIVIDNSTSLADNSSKELLQLFQIKVVDPERYLVTLRAINNRWVSHGSNVITIDGIDPIKEDNHWILMPTGKNSKICCMKFDKDDHEYKFIHNIGREQRWELQKPDGNKLFLSDTWILDIITDHQYSKYDFKQLMFRNLVANVNTISIRSYWKENMFIYADPVNQRLRTISNEITFNENGFELQLIGSRMVRFTKPNFNQTKYPPFYTNKSENYLIRFYDESSKVNFIHVKTQTLLSITNSPALMTSKYIELIEYSNCSLGKNEEFIIKYCDKNVNGTLDYTKLNGMTFIVYDWRRNLFDSYCNWVYLGTISPFSSDKPNKIHQVYQIPKRQFIMEALNPFSFTIKDSANELYLCDGKVNGESGHELVIKPIYTKGVVSFQLQFMNGGWYSFTESTRNTTGRKMHVVDIHDHCPNFPSTRICAKLHIGTKTYWSMERDTSYCFNHLNSDKFQVVFEPNEFAPEPENKGSCILQ
eukprot:39583_1